MMPIKVRCINDVHLLKGNLTYEENNSPAVGVIVILELITDNCEDYNSYIQSTITNCLGEFYFKIYEPNAYYKIKIFDNSDTLNC